MVASFGDKLKIFCSRTPLQASVVRIQALRGDKYALFEAATPEKYSAVLDDLRTQSLFLQQGLIQRIGISDARGLQSSGKRIQAQ